MNTDNTQDGAEPSPASAGSHGQVSVSVHIDDSACAFPASRPLRRPQPTLTDEEREAVEWGSKTLCIGWHDLTPDDKQRSRDSANKLRGLLARLT